MRRLSCAALFMVTLAATIVVTRGGQAIDRDEVRLLSLSASGDPLTGGISAAGDAPSLSASGRYAAFESRHAGMDPDDPTTDPKVFLRDVKKGTLVRVDTAPDGQAADGRGYAPALDAKGRCVAFVSYASNLVAGDTNNESDVFVFDRKKAVIRRVSVSESGAQADNFAEDPAISANGKVVAWTTFASTLIGGDTNQDRDLYVAWWKKNRIVRASVSRSGGDADAGAFDATLSGNGRYAGFNSLATNLVEGDTNGFSDTFVRDLKKGVTHRISVSTAGEEGNWHSWSPALSRNGRYAAFVSLATNLVEGDTNGSWDIFVHDLRKGTTTRVSVASDGTQANDHSSTPTISLNGRYIAFESRATNLDGADQDGEWDTFVHDRKKGVTWRVSFTSQDTEIAGRVWDSTISGNGRVVAFTTDADGVVPADSNGLLDAFVRRWR